MNKYRRIISIGAQTLIVVASVWAIVLQPTTASALGAVTKGLLFQYYDERAALCSSGDGGSVGVSEGDSLKNQEQAFKYFIGRGLSPFQSAGLVGNLVAESGVIPDTQERSPIAGRGGYGIAQWTGSRRVAIENFAPSPDVLKTLQFQLDYLWEQEFLKAYKGVLDNLKAATNIREASNVILHEFEAPKDQSTAVEEKRAALGQKVYDLFGNSTGGVSGTTSANAACASGSTAGFVGFPLKTTKKSMTELNGSCFANGIMCRAGHPYAAHDIMADTGTPVLSIFDGKVIDVGEDKCPGRLVSIYSPQMGVTVSYLHMSKAQTIVSKGDTIKAGQNIGFVGTLAEGCVAAHLHIDAALADYRPGCRREACPAANQKIFQAGSDKIKLPESLYNGYMKLP